MAKRRSTKVKKKARVRRNVKDVRLLETEKPVDLSKLAVGSYYVGIDPGFSGAIAIRHPDNYMESIFAPVVRTRIVMPRAKTKSGKARTKTKTRYDYKKIALLFLRLKRLRDRGCTIIIGIEQQHARPGNSADVVRKLGASQAVWECSVGGRGLDYVMVSPSDWKPRYLSAGSDKKASLRLCRRLYPRLALPLAKDEGRAEAALIADFCYRRDTSTGFLRTRKRPIANYRKAENGRKRRNRRTASSTPREK